MIIQKIKATCTLTAAALFSVQSINALMLSADAAVIASGKCGSNLTWNVDDEANLTISGTGAMYDYYVKTIERSAFSSCDDLSFVYIGKSVASIGDAVFSGSNMWGYVYIRSTDCTISTHEDTFSGVNMIYGISGSTANDRAEFHQATGQILTTQLRAAL